MTSRLLLGMLTPSSNTTLEPVTTAMIAALPEASAHFGRFRVTEIALSGQALSQFDDSEILRAVELLGHAKVDVIAWNGTSSGWLGFEADQRLCRRITEATGIAALANGLAGGAREIDAAGRWVLPGGVDSHCHLDQPMEPPLRMADDFDSGTRSAACGGTTTVIPFAAQRKGDSLRAAVVDYHLRAEGRAHVDYAFHLIVSDPTPEVLAEELPALIAEGYSSFKIYMTYDDLKLNDAQMLDVLEVARRHGAC